MTLIEQYVLKVVDFSSEYGKNGSMCYVSSNIVGAPSIYPEYCDSSSTYSLRYYGVWWENAPSFPSIVNSPPSLIAFAVDFIDLQFEHSVLPVKVNIFETFNPGSVIRIWGHFDVENSWVLLWNGSPTGQIHHSRIVSPALNSISKPINMIRIEFDQRGRDYYSSIDAVQLIGEKVTDFHAIKAESLMSLVKKLNICIEDYSLESILSTGNFLINSDLEKCKNFTSTYEESTSLQPTEFKQKIVEHSKSSSKLKKSKMRQFKESESNVKHLLLLPDEILIKIFQKLDLVSFCRMSSTCSFLHKLLSDPLLYVHINLKNYWWLVSDQTLNWLSSRCGSLQSLDLSWCANFGRTSSQIFMEFIYQCGHNLILLYLNNCSFVDNYCLYIIANTCSQIQVLSLKSCKQIDQLGFGEVKKLSLLRWLDFSNTFIEIHSLDILLQHTPQLQHLLIENCSLLSLDEVCCTLASFNHDLVSLNAWKTRGLTQRGIKALSYLKCLKELDIGWCITGDLSDLSFYELAQSNPNMERVVLSALRCLQDVNLVFSSMWQHLRQIDLMGTNVRKEGVVNLLRNCRKLKFIDVSYCDQISKFTINHWRKVYPRVEIKGGLIHSVRVS